VNRKTGITIAVVLAAAAVLYVIFSQKKTTGAVQTSIGTVPAGGATSLIPLPTPGTVPIATQLQTSAAALCGAVLPNLGTACLVNSSPAVSAAASGCNLCD
jgi:hypothetical protein